MLKKLIQTKSIKAHIVSNFVGNGWSALISIIFVPIYLNYIGAEGYGLIGIFASLQVVLSLMDSGLSTTLNKEMSRLSALPDTEQKMCNLVKTLGNIYWIMAILAGLIAICLSPLLAKYWVHPQKLDEQTITYAFMLLSASLIFQFPSGFYSGGLLGLQRQVMLNILRILFATLRNVGALLVLMFLSKSILLFFGWTLFITIIQAFTFKFFLWYCLPRSKVKPIFDKKELNNVWKFAAGMLGISLTAVLLTQVDKIALSKILSLEQFGYYSIACTLGSMIAQFVNPLTQSYFPKFSNLISINKIDELKRMYHQACQMMSSLVLPATLILMFFSKELIFIWTKNSITAENTWLITSIYAYGTGVNGLMNIPFILTVSYGWTKIGINQNIVLVIFMVPLTIFFALKYGAIGGAISWAIVNTLCFFITPLLIHSKILKGEMGNWYLKDTLLPLIASLSIISFSKYLLFHKSFSAGLEFCIILFVGILSVIVSVLFADQLNKYIIIFFKKPIFNA